MSPVKSVIEGDRAFLIGDGFLITVGTATLAVALTFALSVLEMPSDTGQAILEIGSSVLLLGSGISGVVLAWRLHGRTLQRSTVVGGILGGLASGGVIFLVAIISWLLGLPLRLITDWEFAGPVATLALVSILVAATIIWLSIDAFRDLAPGKRTHVALDHARIASTAVFAVLILVSVYLVFAQPGPEQGEAPIWAIAGGLIGACVVAGADVASGIAGRRQRSEAAPANI